MTAATASPQEVDDNVGVEIAFVASHAPQIFLERGDPPEVLASIHQAMNRMGRRIQESNLDALVVIALDHIHNHFFNLVPSFTVFTGSPVLAAMNQTELRLPARPDLANGLLDHLLTHDFDPAWSQKEVLDHSFMVPLNFALKGGMDVPIIPIIVNTYVPPQPEITRCFKLGREIARWASNAGLRIGTLGTGGMSHYPGTSRYHDPDLAADQRVLEHLKAGEVSKLIEMSPKELDEAGMTELRNWAVAIGARGTSPRPAHVTYEPNDHCGYAVIEF
jgi:2,3-dihydroxyphenylpropionate 1,2-dioxygenase